MNKNKHTAGRKVLFILSLILSFQLIQSCQKEGDFGINPMGISRSSSIDETIRAFQSETARQPQLPSRSMRQKAQKIPQWHLAEKVQISLGEALRVPLKYLKPISIRIADQYVPLEDLTYLLVYRDRTRKEHYEVVTRIPDTEYWIHRHEAGRRFSGTIIVEDWWGRPIKTFGKLSSGKFMHTSNPTLGSIFSIHNGEITPLRRPDTQCGVSVVTNQYMMMEVEFICQGGEIEEPEDLPELYSD